MIRKSISLRGIMNGIVMGILFTFHLSLFTSCTPTPTDVATQDALPPIYPDYCDVTIPENIAPLNFLIREDCEAIEVKAGELTLNASGNEAVFDIDDWKELMQQAADKELEVTVTARVRGRWIQYKPFHWRVVSDEIDPYLTYRLIEPDYEIWNNIQIQQRCIENFDVNALGHYEQLENRCMNCHTYASQNPELSMMYVRGPGGGAILNRNGELSKLNIPGSVYFGFSPSGRYITYSTQKIIPAFHSDPSKRLEVYDATSNVFVADMEQQRIISSPLLSDSLKFETFPTFSPDGKYIYYCAADSVSLPTDIKSLQYRLVRIPFDEATGTIGTQVDTLSTIRSSVCHPRISPDGRFNSRWFVFASKRDDGLYGKPYFCYIDKEGKAHKPFCLPQERPAFYDNNLKSFNAPELGKGKVPFDVNDVAKAMKQPSIEFTYRP